MLKSWRSWALLAERTLRYALGGTLLMLFFTLLNPFNTVEWGDRQSRDVWQRLNADSYGDPLVRDRTTVITLDRASMRAIAPELDGQLDAANLLDIFRTAANLDGTPPAALFIDLLLGDFAPLDTNSDQLLQLPATCPETAAARAEAAKNETYSAFKCMLKGIAALTKYEAWRDKPGCLTGSPLRRLECVREEGGLPILIAEPVDPQSGKAVNMTAGTTALGQVALPVPVIVDKSGYSLVDPEKAEDREGGLFTLYPAALLYAIAQSGCAEADEPGCRPWIERSSKPATLAEFERGLQWKQEFERPIEVIWGTGRPDAFTKAVDALAGGAQARGCAMAPAEKGLRSKTFLRALAGGLNDAGDAKACPYSHSITFDLLLRGLQSPGNNPIRESLAGKIVMIGMDSPESNDFVDAGAQGRVPGVFYHAMALDNLLYGKGSYPKVPEPFFDSLKFNEQDRMNVIGTFAMLLYGGALAAWRRVFPASLQEKKKGRRIVEGIALFLGGFFWMLLMLVVFTGQLKMVPDRFNYAALSLVLILGMIKIAQVTLRPILEELTKRETLVRALFGADEETAPPEQPVPGKGENNAGKSSGATRRLRTRS